MMESDYQHVDEADGAIRAAAKIVPLVLEITGPLESIVDVGGGTGGWLREFGKAGVARLALVDAAVVEPHLVVPRECFHAADLEQPLPTLGRFGMAASLECAEHLSEARAESLVEWLTSASDVVLFSAAIPGQGGKSHINEQFSRYWSTRFGRFRFVRRDLIRQHILNDPSIPWWYRQNLFLYVKQGHPLAEAPPNFLPDDFSLIHQEVEKSFDHPRLKSVLRDLGPALLTSIRSRLRGAPKRDD